MQLIIVILSLMMRIILFSAAVRLNFDFFGKDSFGIDYSNIAIFQANEIQSLAV